MRALTAVLALLVAAVSAKPGAPNNQQPRDTLSGALQHDFNDLLSEVRELGQEFGLQSKDKHVADATPLVLLIGGYSTGKSSLVNSLMNCTSDEIRRGICQRVSLAPEDDRITFLVYNEKGVHVEPIKLVEAQLQGLIHIPHGILSRPNLLERSYVKLLNKPILKEMTLIDTPGITANAWSGVIEENIQVLANYATKILFLVNDMHAGVNHKANVVLSQILDCCANDVEMLFTMPNKFESLNDMIRAQNNWNREMGKIRQQDGDMHQNMQTLYFPDLKWSTEEKQRVMATSKVPLKEFADSFDTLKLKLSNAVALHWQKTLSKALDLLFMTEVYLNCLAYHQNTWSGKFGAPLTATLQQCLHNRYDSEAMTADIPNMKRITDEVIKMAENSKNSKRVTQQALDRIVSSRRTWSKLREQVKDATCAWAQGVEDAFHRLASSSAPAGVFPAWLSASACMFLSMLLARNYLM